MGNRESSFHTKDDDDLGQDPSWDHAWTLGQTLLVTALSVVLVACCFRALKSLVERGSRPRCNNNNNNDGDGDDGGTNCVLMEEVPGREEMA